MIREKIRQITRTLINEYPKATIYEDYRQNIVIINECKIILNKLDGNINIQETAMYNTGIFENVLNLLKGCQ